MQLSSTDHETIPPSCNEMPVVSSQRKRGFLYLPSPDGSGDVEIEVIVIEFLLSKLAGGMASGFLYELVAS
jgi:hypothetical protein